MPLPGGNERKPGAPVGDSAVRAPVRAGNGLRGLRAGCRREPPSPSSGVLAAPRAPGPVIHVHGTRATSTRRRARRRSSGCWLAIWSTTRRVGARRRDGSWRRSGHEIPNSTADLSPPGWPSGCREGDATDSPAALSTPLQRSDVASNLWRRSRCRARCSTPARRPGDQGCELHRHPARTSDARCGGTR